MNKRVFSLAFTLIFCLISADNIYAQAAFYFSPTTDTVIENEGSPIIGYLISNEVASVDKHYTVSYQGGTAGSTTDLGTGSGFSSINITIPAGSDSFPVSIPIYNDSLVELLEYATLILRGVTATDSVGVDSVFTLFIKDDQIPATIGFTISVDSTWESVRYYYVNVHCYNPNPTPVTCYVYIDDSASTCTEYGTDFWYSWRTMVFPPGSSSNISIVDFINDNLFEETEYIIFKLKDYGANTMTDTVFTLYVRDDDKPRPMSAYFEVYTADTVWEDTAAIIPLYITVTNPVPNKTFSYQIYIDSTSTGSTADYTLVNTFLNAPTGVSHDTAYVQIVNDDAMEPTEELRFHIKWGADNITTSADTVFTITILDTDSSTIGFFGAGMSVLESAGTVSAPVVGSSAISYDVNVDVSYYNGNAVPFVDYQFNDTTLVIPANTNDTAHAFITLFDNLTYTGTRQVNLRIDSVYPLTGRCKTGILQYSLFILDDDSTTTGIIDWMNENTRIYPNPFSNRLTIRVEKTGFYTEISNTNGQIIYAEKGTDFLEINTENWPIGMYFAQLFTDEKTYTLKVVKSE